MDNHTLLFQRLMENISVSVFFKDLESRFIAINKTCANKFGISDPEEAIGKTDFDFFSLVHAQVAFEDEQRIIQTLQPLINKEEKEVFLEDGGEMIRWSSTSKFPLIAESGELIGTYGVSKDITEKKLNYQEIERLKDQVESILNAVPNLIFVKDKQGIFRMANAAANDFFRKAHGSVIGKTDEDLGISIDRAKKYSLVEKKVIENQNPVFFPEEKTTLSDGSEVWHQTLKVPFKISKTNEPAVLSVITDVSNRIKQEYELTQSIKTIEKQNHRLLNFAHTVTHYLRNYAGGITMLIDSMKRETDETVKESYFELLGVAAIRLNSTINDLNEIIDKQHN
ncbi:MAG: PAS domain-containing protein, partial [Balneolales bacterium]|nr:PAS domain-containing protein [Balneolales bacterium]